MCEYTSSQKINVHNHINRKKPCGLGDKEIVEIPIEISCKYCKKKFSCSKSLQFHIKNNCKNKDEAKDEEIRKLKQQNLEMARLLSTNIKQAIRTEARKIYKENFSMTCVHCNNDNRTNIQVCHIVPVKDFKPPYTGVNDLDNLIGLCANCHLDYDKDGKFEVTRTVTLHKFLVNHLDYHII